MREDVDEIEALRDALRFLGPEAGRASGDTCRYPENLGGESQGERV